MIFAGLKGSRIEGGVRDSRGGEVRSLFEAASTDHLRCSLLLLLCSISIAWLLGVSLGALPFGSLLSGGIAFLFYISSGFSLCISLSLSPDFSNTASQVPETTSKNCKNLGVL